MLRWHYRSQHESLIALSNRAFYDSNLVLFPSPDGERSYSGLRVQHNPDSVYDRGGSRTNRLEAAEVVQGVMAHAREFPHLSLGVATFSGAQQKAIQLELEQARANDPSCESFFAQHEHEPFFVKNLENVQGDERDVIFISVGYGRDKNGKVNLNFGPLNGRGGERRLNVLITRSRLRCVVFTNMTSADIDLKRTDALGIKYLKEYFAFAETGDLEQIEVEPDDKERPFFDSVKA
ncbi:MAG: C-terminal helicase domain-containing protein, partial [Chloroflexota bacterium]